MDGTAFGYHDGIVLYNQRLISDEYNLVVMRCNVCHELRDDLSMPCQYCGEVE